MKKHWLFTALLAIALCVICFTLFPTEARAASVDDLTFTLNSDGQSYAVTDCNTSASGELVIPATYDGKPVTNIGDFAFANCRDVVQITIPDSVSTIGENAFAYCDNLTGIFVSERNPNYSNDAYGVLFSKGKTELICAPGALSGNYTIPDSVISIGSYAFHKCNNLTSIAIPDSVTRIGVVAVYKCPGLTSVTIGNGVKTLENSTFQDCENLTDITLSDSVTMTGIEAFDNCAVRKLIVAEGAKTITSAMVICKNSLQEIEIPDSVTTIGYYAFWQCTNLTSITIPDSVTAIGNGAFYECDMLTSVTLGNDVTSVGIRAFSRCHKLSSITIPDSVKTIGEYAFELTGLTSIIIPHSVTSIGYGAFSCCSNLTSVTIGDGVTTIGDYAFFKCDKISSITLPDSLTGLGDFAFYGCTNLTQISIPGSVSKIGENAFRECTGLVNIDIPYGVTIVGQSAFLKCTNLMSISLPSSLDFIANSAFGDCNNLTDVYYSGAKSWWNKIIISSENTCLTAANIHFAIEETKITSQPKTAKVKVGATAMFTVKASGEGLKYQWQSSSNGKTWKNCSSSSAKKATFTFTSKTSHSSNYYRCRVTDAAGNTIYTDVVRLYVLGVTTQPKTQKVEAGEKVKFTVAATGAGKVYQWQVSTDGKTWKNCSSSSATKATFTFTSKTSHSSNYYRCRIKDSGGNTVYTDAVRLYVLGITEQPVSKTVTKGKTAKFTVEATGASKVYQWQVSTDGGKTWKNCSSSSAKKATFTFTSKTTHNGNYYRCRIKDSGGNTVYTTKVKLTVKK